MRSTLLSYPGLSAELVINKNYECAQFYELVSSCGVFCRMPVAMQRRFLNILQKNNSFNNVIFITDNNNKEKISHLLFSTLPNAKVVTFENTSDINLYGLRVNTPQFSDSEKFKKLIRQYPNSLVLISTPYSCPDLSEFVTNEDTLANRSSLFFFENKKVYIKRFKKELNFVEEFKNNNFEKLSQFFTNCKEDELFFLKPSGEFTGGSTVIPLNKKVFFMNLAKVKALLRKNIYFLFRQIDALNIKSPKGFHFGTQFRAFISTEGEFIGFIVKFSKDAIKHSPTKTSLKELNKIFNSSSGTAISIIFEKKNQHINPVSLSLSKEETITDKQHIDEFLSQLQLGSLSFSKQEDLNKIMHIIYPKANEIRISFDDFFFKQKWGDLYKKFIVDKTYMD